MSRRRFFVPSDRIQDNSAHLSPEESHHLKTVLRLKDGDEVEIFDGSGRVFCGKVQARGQRVAVDRLREIQIPGRALPLILAPALIKSDRFEWILQKGTELGVAEFLPIQTTYSNVRIPEARLAGRLERWRRIVRESAKQSRSPMIPKVRQPMSFKNLLEAKDFEACAKFMLWEKANSTLTRNLPKMDRLLLCVGPEGGWDSSEVKAAEGCGYGIFSLGPAILRAETAALAGVAVLQFLISSSG